MKKRFLFCLTVLIALSAAAPAFCAESTPKKTYQKREKVFQKRTKTYQPRNTVRNNLQKKREQAETDGETEQNPNLYSSSGQGSRQFSGLSSATRITMPSVTVSYPEVPVAFGTGGGAGSRFLRAETPLRILYSCQKGTVDVIMTAAGRDVVELSDSLQQGTCRYDLTLKNLLAYRKIAENVRKDTVDLAKRKIGDMFKNALESGTTCKIMGERLTAVQKLAESRLPAEYERRRADYDAKDALKGDPCGEKP